MPAFPPTWLDSRVSLSRRRALQGLGALALAPAVVSGAAAGAARGPVTPSFALGAFRKLRYAMHEQPLFWWIKATKYGLVDSRLTPLYGMEIATVMRVRDLGADRFAATSLEMVFSTDVTTGALLEELKNPYTGESAPVSHVPLGPTTVEYGLDGPDYPQVLPGAKLDVSHDTGVQIEGERIWVRDDSMSVVTSTSGDRPPFVVSDWATFLGRVADIDDPSIASAPCTLSFQSISNWQARMRMGEQPGSMISRGSGAKVARYGDLPGRVRELMAQVHPDIHDDPVAALSGPEYVFKP